jgi:hypothetical protein
MNAPWTRQDYRLDVELSVALDLAARHLTQARSNRQLDHAVTFNLRLWRLVRRLAEVCPSLIERDMLVDAADHVAMMLVVDAHPCPDPRDLAFIAGRNLSLARDLAGQVAADCGLGDLLARWSDAGAGPGFEPWLLDRLAAYLPPG